MALNVREMLTGDVRRISTVYRYSSFLVHRRENVAEHTFYCCLYAYLIALDLEDEDKYLCQFNMETLFERALLHDIDESLTGDFLRSIKHGDDDIRKGLKRVSKKMITKLEKSLGTSLQTPWENCKANDLEGDIISLADFLCVVAYLCEEFKSGNRHIVVVLHEVKAYLEKMNRGEGINNSLKLLSRYIKESLDLLNEVLRES